MFPFDDVIMCKRGYMLAVMILMLVNSRSCFNIKTIRIHVINISRLIFMMGITTLIRRNLYIETAPSFQKYTIRSYCNINVVGMCFMCNVIYHCDMVVFLKYDGS